MDEEVLFQWRKARDIFLGFNLHKRDFARGLAMAQGIQHSDAIWLCNVFSEGLPQNKEDVCRAFMLPDNVQENEGRALCFSAFAVLPGVDQVVFPVESRHMKTAREKGNALALAWTLLNDRSVANKEHVELAYKTEKFPEPAIIFLMGMLLREQNSITESNKLIQRAAQLGFIEAQVFLCEQGGELDPNSYMWLGRAALSSRSKLLVRMLIDVVRTTPMGTCLYQLGQLFSTAEMGQLRRGFGVTLLEGENLRAVYHSIQYYKDANEAVLSSIKAFVLVNTRLRLVCKDVRNIITRMIWNDRATIEFIPSEERNGQIKRLKKE